jgi:uncharacterized protein
MEQVKGSLKLELGQDNLSAMIVITPSEEGALWSLPKISNLLEEKGIIEGVSKARLKEALNAAASAQEGTPVRVEIAKGTEPVPDTPEYFDWKELPVPESMQEESDKAFRIAGAPNITIAKIEKVKQKKKVLKKSKLPFLPDREEVVELWQKITKEEPAPVNPKVLGTGYVEAGTIIAERRPVELGKDGRTVFGKPIVPKPVPPAQFYPGSGIKVDRNGIAAEKSGFFRRGENWAEVVDFLPHTWDLSFTKDKATVLLDFQPGHQGASLPDVAEIYGKAEADFCFDREHLRPETEVVQLLQRSARSGQALERIPLNTDRDASFAVKASPDGLLGTLDVVKGSGRGKALVLKDVGAAIKAAGFVGLDYEKIKNDLLEFYRGQSPEIRGYVLAQGKAPTRGGDREFQFSVHFLPETEYEELKEAKSGFESERAYPSSRARQLASVSEGDVVGIITSAEPGEPGKDIFGKQLPGIAGNDPHVEVLENIRHEKDRFIAEATGLLEVFSGDDRENTETEQIVLRIRPHIDAAVKVELSADRMEGYLTIEPHKGSGARANRSQIDNAIEAGGIKKGIDETAITEALEISATGSPVRRAVVARGKIPAEAGESRLKLMVETASGKGVTIKGSGRADYRNQDRFVAVKEDQLLAEILPDNTAVEDGWDVCGKEIAASDSPVLEIEIGDQVRREEEGDRIRLYSRCAGELLYEKKKIDVLKVHAVSGDVDLSSGNIKFPGTVTVSGSVKSGFSILAEGHIKIAGNVEAALVSSGESITIAQGVIGSGKAVIRAKTTIETIFSEQATLLAVGHVSMKNGCLRNMVKCNGRLRLVGEKGNLLGGVVRAREGIVAANLGNDKGVRTEISFGQDYLVMDRIETEEKEIRKLRDAIARLDTAMEAYEKKGDRKNLETARRDKLNMMKTVEKRGLLLFTLRERFEQHFDSAVQIRGTVYPGVVVESHGRYWKTDSPKKGITLRFDQETGHIIEQSGEKPADKPDAEPGSPETAPTADGPVKNEERSA